MAYAPPMPRWAKRSQKVVSGQTGMIEDLLEFRLRFVGKTRCQIGLATQIDGIGQYIGGNLGSRQFVTPCLLQNLNGLRGVVAMKFNGGSNRRQPVFVQQRVEGKALVQVMY